jgi:hypothetical protein
MLLGLCLDLLVQAILSLLNYRHMPWYQTEWIDSCVSTPNSFLGGKRTCHPCSLILWSTLCQSLSLWFINNLSFNPHKNILTCVLLHPIL